MKLFSSHKHNITDKTREYLRKEKPHTHTTKCSSCDNYLYMAKDYDFYNHLEYLVESVGKKRND